MDRDRRRDRRRDRDDDSRRHRHRHRSRTSDSSDDDRRKHKHTKTPIDEPKEDKPKKKSLWDTPIEVAATSSNPLSTLTAVIPTLPPSYSSATFQQQKQAKRLYVGGILPGTTDPDIRAFFRDEFHRRGWWTPEGGEGDPVVEVSINYEKSYAFVEFRKPQQATLGMGLGGCVLKGVMLKIKRPKEYIPVDNDAASYQMLMASAASTSSHTSLSPSQGVSQPSFGYHPTPVSSATPASSMPVHSIPQPASTSLLAPGADNPNKIYIGNLPHTMTDGELLQLLSSIGHLKAINLVKEQGTSLNRGYAFCEYQDPSLTDIACSQLTGRVVKDKTIFAQRASIGAKKSTDVTTDQHLIQTLSTGGGTIITATSSRVVLFLNLCNEFDLVSDADFESILRDFTAECARYGTITAVVFPRPDETIRSRITDLTLDEKERDQTKLHLLGTIGRIYVKYSDPKEAQRAVSLINGCAFQGRTIITAFFKEELFDAGERL